MRKHILRGGRTKRVVRGQGRLNCERVLAENTVYEVLRTIPLKGAGKRSSGRSREAHIASVVHMLLLVRAPIEVLAAGVLHDHLEGQNAWTSEDLLRVMRRKLLRVRSFDLPRYLQGNCRMLDHCLHVTRHDHVGCVIENFCETVINLVLTVTEPRGSKMEWEPRKMSFLMKMLAADIRANLLGAALKIEGLQEGIGVHRLGLDTTVWSQAGLTMNVWFFSRCISVFRRKGVNPWLIDFLRDRLAEFRKGPASIGGASMMLPSV